MAISTSINNSAVIMQYFKRKALDRLVQKTHLYALGFKNTLPTESGKSITWVRFGLQAAATTPLVEGALVTPTNVTSSNLTANLLQYGAVFAASDILVDVSVTPMEEALQEQASQSMAYTIEALIRAEVDSSCVTAGTNLFTPSTVANNVIANITATDVLKAVDVRRAVGRIKRNAVPLFDGNKIAMVVHTSQAVDLRSESGVGGFLDLVKQASNSIGSLEAGLVGGIFGASIYETALQPVINNGTTDVYYAYAFGDNSLGVCDLESQNMKTFRKGPQKTGTYDTLEQIGTSLGWKAMFAAKNLTGVETGVAANDARIMVIASAASI
jgi:N4-gp56 family major capsid protein